MISSTFYCLYDTLMDTWNVYIISVCMYLFMLVCMYICMYVCMYVCETDSVLVSVVTVVKFWDIKLD